MHYKFSRFFSLSALDARKFDVGENYHNRTTRINWYVCKNVTTQIGFLMLDVRKFSCAEISTFTVVKQEITECKFNATQHTW